jgi:hypothetical protein
MALIVLPVSLWLLLAGAPVARAQEDTGAREDTGAQADTNDATPRVTETAEPRVELSTFRAEVRPELEVVLPTGAITQSIPLQFGNFGIDTTLGYAVNGNELDGEMVFSYRVWRLLPQVSFFQSVDFEDYVDPQFSTSGVDVFSDEEFISRRRGLKPQVSMTVLPDTRVGSALGVTDIYKWNLSNDELVDDGLDLVPEIFVIYDNMKAVDPNRELEFSGVAARTSVSQRFRNNFDNPVSLEWQNRLLLRFLLGEDWSIEEQLTFDSITRIWDEELARVYQLGGFDSIRGYAPNEIEAVRAGMLSTGLSRRILRGLDTSFRVRERRRVAVHQYRLFTLTDLAVTQSALALDSKPSFYGSAGGGIGAVISSGRIHLDLSVTVSQPFELDRLPVVYIRTTLFNFERRF